MSRLDQEFEALVETFAERLVGDASPDTIAKIKMWAIYSHIHKSMPALASHWNQMHPEGKADIRRLFEEIRDRNQALRGGTAPEAPQT